MIAFRKRFYDPIGEFSHTATITYSKSPAPAGYRLYIDGRLRHTFKEYKHALNELDIIIAFRGWRSDPERTAANEH